MSRRGNCHDNAVAESFFAMFKKRVTKAKIYATLDEARSGIFNFIEMFYNSKTRHSHTDGASPAEFGLVYETDNCLVKAGKSRHSICLALGSRTLTHS